MLTIKLHILHGSAAVAVGNGYMGELPLGGRQRNKSEIYNIRSTHVPLLAIVDYKVAVGTTEYNPRIVVVVSDGCPSRSANWPMKRFVYILDRLAGAQVPYD